MSIAEYKVSERGQMALPAEVRRRWKLGGGGMVDVADLGWSVVIVPADNGGLRKMLSDAIEAGGGYHSLVQSVTADEPDLA
jgi:AbrB family looped-hinge helix DNA binding protein